MSMLEKVKAAAFFSATEVWSHRGYVQVRKTQLKGVRIGRDEFNSH